MIQAVLFDYDGVLVNSMPYHVQAWQTIFNEYGIEIAPEEVLLAEGTTSPELARDIFSDRKREISAHEIETLVDKKQNLYREITRAELEPGANQLLVMLKNAGMKLALVTGTVRANLDRSLPGEVITRFDAIVTGEDVENGKPEPEPYLQAAQSLAAEPEKCLVIENAPYGIESAHRAGMLVIAVTSTLNKSQLSGADFYAGSVQELFEKWPEVEKELFVSNAVTL